MYLNIMEDKDKPNSPIHITQYSVLNYEWPSLEHGWDGIHGWELWWTLTTSLWPTQSEQSSVTSDSSSSSAVSSLLLYLSPTRHVYSEIKNSIRDGYSISLHAKYSLPSLYNFYEVFKHLLERILAVMSWWILTMDNNGLISKELVAFLIIRVIFIFNERNLAGPGIPWGSLTLILACFLSTELYSFKTF